MSYLYDLFFIIIFSFIIIIHIICVDYSFNLKTDNAIQKKWKLFSPYILFSFNLKFNLSVLLNFHFSLLILSEFERICKKP